MNGLQRAKTGGFMRFVTQKEESLDKAENDK